ncbi:DUF4158 domain-containing protein [Glacieibacterium megasporae]|uniref:DUF4158 domain-containing protein n=1 Tax=Glacieibacterium megasporae TaxID=2835787 RepID=UPI001C1DF4BF|nr:DUF4158 domain-containing protein [Polymorphobacter megasporae]UAJ10678.1 DUF4158 domain-containing protein [Polymorphobacter megasporae]
MATIKRRWHDYRELTRPVRAALAADLLNDAIGLIDGRVLIDRLVSKLRAERIVIPGITVIEHMAAEAMHAASLMVIDDIAVRLSSEQRSGLDALLSEKEKPRKSRLSWLRERRHGSGACARSAKPIPDR